MPCSHAGRMVTEQMQTHRPRECEIYPKQERQARATTEIGCSCLLAGQGRAGFYKAAT
jgi:hypothetical protein